jgi:hypothetical protein
VHRGWSLPGRPDWPAMRRPHLDATVLRRVLRPLALALSSKLSREVLKFDRVGLRLAVVDDCAELGKA